MTRAQAISFLQERYSSVVDEDKLGLTLTDDSGGFKVALDNALLEIGYTYSQLPTTTVGDSDVPAFRAVLAYYALRHIAEAAIPLVSIQTDFPRPLKRSEDIFTHIMELLKTALAEAQGFGYLTSIGIPQIQIASYTLDFLEPECE